MSLPLTVAVAAGAAVAATVLARLVLPRRERPLRDPLTGLPDARLFEEQLGLALAFARRRNATVPLLLLGLDAPAGDSLQRAVADRLQGLVREGDLVARVGGDTFAILLQEPARHESPRDAADKLLRALAEPFPVDGQTLRVTACAGVTVYPDGGRTAGTLLEVAAAALGEAKGAGPNTWRFATGDEQRPTDERAMLEHDLQRAVDEQQFTLLFQPQIETDGGGIIGMEALIRWNHPERGVISPQHFIGIAEERGLILPIGAWVIRESCRAVRRFHDMGLPHFRVAVNLSARQFRDPGLLTTVQSALAEAGVEAAALELEITETVAMDDVELTMSTLAELRRLGVTIAIDDFGTGHSSLSYLKRFPIDALKIDRGFVFDLPDKFEDAAIVSSVIQLGNGLGLRVVAEGVETRDQLDFLSEGGCREVQGFFFSYPIPIDDLERMVLTQETTTPLR
jgi:diguanylate cyclase (GGDEF)-like protein